MWLIYNIEITDEDIINLLMTFSTPNCPLWDLIISMVKKSILEKFPNTKVNIELTFDPLWSIDMMKDDDLKRLFQ
jgi:metal-sulfur cluster biosynthetic enzyme